MRTADVIVIGAGVIGASVAYHLARRGRRVIVLERASDLGAGSTAKATGGFRAQFDNEIDVRLSMLARQKLLAFEEETGVDSGYRPYGYLFVATTSAAIDAMRDAQRVQHACGLTEARMVDVNEIRALNPAIEGDAIVGGTFCPTDGFIRPMNILRGYADAARRLGVTFVFNAEQHSFTMRGDRIASVQTSAGEFAADVVVNARGAWAGAPVVPLRRNVAATIETHLLPDTMPMTIWAENWYHLRVRDGRVLLLWPDDPPIDDRAWLDEVLRLTRARIPRLREVPIDHTWSGLYEMSPDGHALLGRSPSIENLFLATGSSGHGVMHAPALGQLLAEVIVDGAATTIDVSALDPARFG